MTPDDAIAAPPNAAAAPQPTAPERPATQPPAPQLPPPAPPLDHHGGPRSRGIESVPHSSIESGKFGRLFRNLAPLSLTDDQLAAVAAGMVETTPAGGWGGAPTDGDNPDLEAGWTYFAQLVDHDITFDPVSMLGAANDPDALENYRTPRFDLDFLYGDGPKASPHLYDQNNPLKLLVDVNTDGFAPVDLPRNRQGRALIGDPRNDVHAIIAQLHLLLIQFHNAVVDAVTANPVLVGNVPPTPPAGYSGGPTDPTAGPQPTFEQVATLVRWHYQWLVLKELLPRIVGADTAGKVLPTKGKGANAHLQPDLILYNVRKRPWMPVEFSSAAYRFGHSMVRDAYQLNATSGVIPVFSASDSPGEIEDLRGFRRLPAALVIEWHRFFGGRPDLPADTQHARAFDTKIAASLTHLPTTVDGPRRSLALLNLFRGQALGLPSGEDVAAYVTAQAGLAPTNVMTGLPHPSPLWFWLLKEAEAGGGRTLGPVGGRIVAEVLVGLAAKDPGSFLKVQPTWTPTLGTDGTFTVTDLIRLAGGTS